MLCSFAGLLCQPACWNLESPIALLRSLHAAFLHELHWKQKYLPCGTLCLMSFKAVQSFQRLLPAQVAPPAPQRLQGDTQLEPPSGIPVPPFVFPKGLARPARGWALEGSASALGVSRDGRGVLAA